MCIRLVMIASGIPVKFDDKHEPAFSGLRKKLGLKVENDSEESEQQAPAPIKVRPNIEIAREPAGFVASGRSFKMGCGMGGQKMIRGSRGGY